MDFRDIQNIKVGAEDIQRVMIGTEEIWSANPFELYDPILYYPFNGNLLDYSGNGYNATIGKGTLTYNNDRIGDSNKEIYSPDKTYIKGYWGSDLQSSSTVSICFWYKYTSGDDREIIGIYDTVNAKRSWTLAMKGDIYTLRIAVSETGRSSTGEFLLFDNTVDDITNWHHYCIQWDDQDVIELYQDGVLIGSITTKVPFDTGYNYFSMGYRIGNDDTSSASYINGYYSDLLAYDKMLNVTQINDIMNKTSVSHVTPYLIKYNGVTYKSYDNGDTFDRYLKAPDNPISTNTGLRNIIAEMCDTYGFDVNLNWIDTSETVSFRSIFGKVSAGDPDHAGMGFNGRCDKWDLSSCTTLENLCNYSNQSGTYSFNNPWIKYWDVSNVQNFKNLMRVASGFNQDLSGWCVGSATDYSNFDVSNSTWENMNKPNFANPPC